jgi:hypothetical protein
MLILPAMYQSTIFGAGARELVGMAHAARFDLDQHLARFRAVEIDRLDHQGLARLVGDRRSCLHSVFIYNFLSAGSTSRAKSSMFLRVRSAGSVPNWQDTRRLPNCISSQ